MSASLLVIENSDDDYESIIRAFGKVGIDLPVMWCRSGEEALGFLRRNATPALILLDLNMPGLDGNRTLWALKADEQLRHIPVAILSTSNDERNIRHCYQMGASVYVQKSIDFDHFVEDIRELKQYCLTLPTAQGVCV